MNCPCRSAADRPECITPPLNDSPFILIHWFVHVCVFSLEFIPQMLTHTFVTARFKIQEEEYLSQAKPTSVVNWLHNDLENCTCITSTIVSSNIKHEAKTRPVTSWHMYCRTDPPIFCKLPQACQKKKNSFRLEVVSISGWNWCSHEFALDLESLHEFGVCWCYLMVTQ